MTQRARSETEKSDYREVNNPYYDLVTDFYEFGWGRSFHFAPRVPGESFKASLARHERYLAQVLGLKPGMVVADVGSGVGGPLLEIARFSGAKIVGINSNTYQLERARRRAEEAQLAHLADFLHCDFLQVDAPDESFDAAYSIEATCIAPDKLSIYAEIFRLLKPGACFAAYEYCVTDRFDHQDPRHLQIKADIQLGGGLLVIDDEQTVDIAQRAVGFEVLETRDLSNTNRPIHSLVSTPGGLPFFSGRLSQFKKWTVGDQHDIESARRAPHCTGGNSGPVGDFDSLRGCHGRGGSAGHLHADVLHPRPQTGVARSSLFRQTGRSPSAPV